VLLLDCSTAAEFSGGGSDLLAVRIVDRSAIDLEVSAWLVLLEMLRR